MKLFNLTQNVVLAEKVVLADTFWTRMKGLLGRASLDEDEAIIITQCRSIHMFFMRFAIDVIFLDDNYVVVGLVRGIKPFRLSPLFLKARYAAELKEGKIKKTKTCLGDKLQLE